MGNKNVNENSVNVSDKDVKNQTKLSDWHKNTVMMCELKTSKCYPEPWVISFKRRPQEEIVTELIWTELYLI